MAASRLLFGPIFIWSYFSFCKACIPGVPFGYPFYQPSYVAPYQYGVYPYAKSRASNTHKSVDASSDSCLSRFQNMKLTCAEPIAQRSSLTEEECSRVCLEEVSGCRSFQFFLDAGHCEIFAVKPPVPTTESMPLAKDDILMDSKDSFSYRKRRKRQVCEPAVVPSIGSDVFVPNPNCMAMENVEFTKYMLNGPTDVFHADTTQSVLSDCVGSVARIQIIDGVALSGDSSTKSHIIAKTIVESADICLLLCRNNAYLDGRRFSSRCASVTFDRDNGLCLIFNDTISPNGNLQYNPTPSTVYFEKTCIPMHEIQIGCEEAFYRIPQRVMIASPNAKTDAPTLNSCIRMCITSLKQRGFACRSIVYYSGQEWSTQNCLLYQSTRRSNPELIRSELQHEVDYVELPSCMIHGRQHDEKPTIESVPWSEWSECGPTMTRTRHRNCTGCPRRNETEPCVSENRLSEDFANFFDEDENPSPVMEASYDPTTRIRPSSSPTKEILSSTKISNHSPTLQPFEKTIKSHDKKIYKDNTGSKDTSLAALDGPLVRQSSSSANDCDPMIRCCPYSSDIKHGCSLGYQINAENKREPCIPDECN